jgi:hypothetical protein
MRIAPLLPALSLGQSTAEAEPISRSALTGTLEKRPIMGPGSLLREAWELVPIFALLVVGGLIVLQSGVNRPATSDGMRQVAGNLTRMLLRVMGYVGTLLALQYLIGMPPLKG